MGFSIQLDPSSYQTSIDFSAELYLREIAQLNQTMQAVMESLGSLLNSHNPPNLGDVNALVSEMDGFMIQMDQLSPQGKAVAEMTISEAIRAAVKKAEKFAGPAAGEIIDKLTKILNEFTQAQKMLGKSEEKLHEFVEKVLQIIKQLAEEIASKTPVDHQAFIQSLQQIEDAEKRESQTIFLSSFV